MIQPSMSYSLWQLVGFDVVEDFLDMAILSSTTTGQVICEHVME